MRSTAFLTASTLGFLVVALSTPTPVRAQESTIQTTPTIIQVEINPGEIYESNEVIIFNPSISQPQQVEIFPNDLTIADEKGTYSFVADSHDRYSLSRWITVSPEAVSLQPQEPQYLKLTIDVPEDAEPGGHYGIILATATPEGGYKPGTGGALVRNIGGVGTVLLVTVPGEMSWDGRIVEFLPVPFLNLGPVNFTVRFENQGTVHYSPHGQIEIFDLFGGKVGEVEIKPHRTFPQKIRRLEATWERLLLIGKYRARATVYYGQEGQEKVTAAEIFFWTFPYKPMAVLLLTIAVAIAVAKLRKKLNRSENPSPSPA